jgi:hypothetical protein
MKLKEYLAEQKETQVDFAKRTLIPQTTIAAITMGGGTRSSTAKIIINATGGLVCLDDLVGDGSALAEDLVARLNRSASAEENNA